MKTCPWFTGKVNYSKDCPFTKDPSNCPWGDVSCDNHKSSKTKKEVKKDEQD